MDGLDADGGLERDVDLEFVERVRVVAREVCEQMGVDAGEIVVEDRSARLYRDVVRLEPGRRLIVGSGLLAEGDLDLVRAAVAYSSAFRDLASPDRTTVVMAGIAGILPVFLLMFMFELGVRNFWIFLIAIVPSLAIFVYRVVAIRRRLTELWKPVFMAVEDHQTVWRLALLQRAVDLQGPVLKLRDQRYFIERAARELGIDVYLPDGRGGDGS